MDFRYGTVAAVVANVRVSNGGGTIIEEKRSPGNDAAAAAAAAAVAVAAGTPHWQIGSDTFTQRHKRDKKGRKEKKRRENANGSRFLCRRMYTYRSFAAAEGGGAATLTRKSSQPREPTKAATSSDRRSAVERNILG